MSYPWDGQVLLPFDIFQVIEFKAKGTVSAIPMPPSEYDEDSSSSDSSSSGSGGSGDSDDGFNIDDFDINDPSTWPSG